MVRRVSTEVDMLEKTVRKLLVPVIFEGPGVLAYSTASQLARPAPYKLRLDECQEEPRAEKPLYT